MIPPYLLLSLLMALVAMVWLLMTGVLPHLAVFLLAFLFFAGSLGWSALLRGLLGSARAITGFLPLGFGVSCLLSLLLLQARLGTIPAGILASLLPLFLLQRHPRRFFAPLVAEAPPAIPAASLQGMALQLVCAALIATFLTADQLLSARSLADVVTDTSLRGWNDLLDHANTTLSLSRLAPGVAPVSIRDALQPMSLYHMGSYVLPALLRTAQPGISPLAAYTSLVAPLGFTLLLLPILERLSARRTASPLLFGSGVILVYSLWIRLLTDSLYDPVWLLITGPATLYACAVVVAVLDAGVEAAVRHVPAAKALALLFLAFLLVLVFKIQVAQSMLMAFVALGVALLVHLLLPRAPSLVRLGAVLAAWGLVLALQQALYQRLGMASAQPLVVFKSFVASGIDRTLLTRLSGSGLSLPLPGPLRLAIGALILSGPLFTLGWLLLGLRRRRTSPVTRLLPPLLLVSFLLGLLVHPVMPWDGGEFLNRSWPVLWCIGLWMLACAPWPAGILPSPPFREPRWLVLSAAALLALSWMVLPPIRRASIAAPLLADWAQPGYPLSIPAKEKSLARDLRLVVGDGFFYHPDSSLSVPLAALSGSRIVFMDPGLWIRLEARMREERVAGIRARQQTLQAEYAAACSRGATALRAGSPGGSAGLVVLPPIQPRTWALCTNNA